MPNFMTGAKPTPRHALATARPYHATSPAPDRWCRFPKKKSMWNNATYGCCVTTSEAFKCACSGVFISDAEVKRWAQAHGVLNGAYLNEVLDWMAQRGFSQDGNFYNDGPKASVDWTNAALLCNAIYSGPVKIGVAASQLQGVVTNSDGWFGVGFQQDPNLDHCVELCAYGPMSWLAQELSLCYGLNVSVPSNVDGSKPGYGLFTWDTIGVVDIASMVAITGEAWSRTPETVVVGTGTPTHDDVYTPSVPPPPPPPSGIVNLSLSGPLPAGTYQIPLATDLHTLQTVCTMAAVPLGTVNWGALMSELAKDAPLVFQVIALVGKKDWAGLAALATQAGPAVVAILAALGISLPTP